MSEHRESSTPNGNGAGSPLRNIYIALYALVTILVLILTIFLSIRALSPQPRTIPTLVPATSTTPAPSPSSTPSPSTSPTPRATFTPRPSVTSSVSPTPTTTPTQTLPPSLTPAFPGTDTEDYHLADWSPELADRLIDLLQAYPRTLSAFARGPDDAGFYQAFYYAIFALREALLQFPNVPQADAWLWDLAFNRASLADQEAGGTYAVLITAELNRENVTLDDLPEYVESIDPRIELEMQALPAISGYSTNNIVKVSTKGNGGAVFWLLETTNGFESYPLASEFDFIRPTSVDFFVEDLTDDGKEEIVIFRSAIPGEQGYAFPRIFSLGQAPPAEIFFEPLEAPKVSPDLEVNWAPVEVIPSEGDLQFFDTLFPACPVQIQHFYKWNGTSFEFLSAEYDIEPDEDLLSFCEVVVNHAIQVWGPDPTIQIMETLLPLWPPERTAEGAAYAEDALDEWRFRLGVYHALEGNRDQSREYLEGIITIPSMPDSRWIEPAQQFLETYQDQRDIYRACLLADFCEPRAAIRVIADTLSGDDYSNALQILKDSGLLIRASGFFDFDDDGETERWFILRATSISQPEFWIFAQTEEDVEALLIGQVEEVQPRITFVDSNQEPPIVQVGQGTTFIFQNDPSGPGIKFTEPARVFSVDITQEKLDEIEAALLSGEDPAELRQELLDLEGSAFFTCNFIICPRFHYLLGLANELSGNERSAVEAYLELWREFPRSPFTTMARLKLEGEIPTPTPTPMATTTLTPTPSPTAGGPTGTATGAPTPGPTATPVEGYPAPFPTDTPRSGYP